MSRIPTNLNLNFDRSVVEHLSFFSSSNRKRSSTKSNMLKVADKMNVYNEEELLDLDIEISS
jgi:hypothetical protein